MSSKTSKNIYLRVSTKGFIPFEIPESYKITSAKLENHPQLEGKSHLDLHEMISSNDIKINFLTARQQVGEMYIRPELRMGNSVIAFHREEVFVADPVVEKHMDGLALKVKIDIKIDLVELIEPSQFQAFLKLFNSGGFTNVGWTYNCTLKEGGKKTSRAMVLQDADCYNFEIFESRSSILEAE